MFVALGEGVPFLALMVLWIFCIVDVIRYEDGETRHLPKIGWLLVVLLLPDVGSILWLLFGRSYSSKVRREVPRGHMQSFPEYDRPGRMSAASPDDDEEFLRTIRERAEAQRKRAAEQRKAQEAAEREADQRRRDARGGEPAP
jgi:hypothetical protein